MPVQRRSSGTEARAIVFAFVGVLAAIGLMWFFADQSGGDGAGPTDFQIQIGDEQFDAGSAAAGQAEIDDRGPILYSDVAGGDRDIILQHVGEDAETGWIAFAAQRPGSPRSCFLRWDAAQELFVDTCDDTTVAADGGDLPRYPVEVNDDGRVIVDLNELE